MLRDKRKKTLTESMLYGKMIRKKHSRRCQRMLEIHKKIVLDEDQRPFAVQIPIKEFERLEEVLENATKLRVKSLATGDLEGWLRNFLEHNPTPGINEKFLFHSA